MALHFPNAFMFPFSNPVPAIACMDITAVVESARQQREEILRRKEPVNPEVGEEIPGEKASKEGVNTTSLL